MALRLANFWPTVIQLASHVKQHKTSIYIKLTLQPQKVCKNPIFIRSGLFMHQVNSISLYGGLEKKPGLIGLK